MDNNPSSNTRMPVDRGTLILIIYIVIFGVIWGLGSSLLAVTLPADPVTRVIVIGWFEMLIVILAKISIRHPLSTTFCILIATTISIFTFSFGPPNPYKHIFVIAGLGFDAGTLFRTQRLKTWNLVCGAILFVVGSAIAFPTMAWLLDPSLINPVLAALPLASVIYIAIGVVVSIILGQTILKNPPYRIRSMWRQMGQNIDEATP